MLQPPTLTSEAAQPEVNALVAKTMCNNSYSVSFTKANSLTMAVSSCTSANCSQEKIHSKFTPTNSNDKGANCQFAMRYSASPSSSINCNAITLTDSYSLPLALADDSPNLNSSISTCGVDYHSKIKSKLSNLSLPWWCGPSRPPGRISQTLTTYVVIGMPDKIVAQPTAYAYSMGFVYLTQSRLKLSGASNQFSMDGSQSKLSVTASSLYASETNAFSEQQQNLENGCSRSLDDSSLNQMPIVSGQT